METQKLFFEMVKYNSGDRAQIFHFINVHGFARRIGLAEGLDEKTQFILEAAALVHDIGITPAIKKYGSADGKYQEELGPAEADETLRRLSFDKDAAERVCYLVSRHHTLDNIDGIDHQILIEADFLVNLAGEKNASRVEAIIEKHFKTEAGKSLCRTMYL